jgi:hypothetical protein
MSWVDTISSTVRVMHTSRGQDVMLTKTTSDATFDYYAPQAGFHYAHVRRKIASPNTLEVKQLSGDVFVYDVNGLLVEVRDTLVTPNAVKIAYATGNVVDTVTDAANLRRLKFNYTSNLLTSIDYQLKISTVWTTQHTTTYGYTSGALTTVTIGGQLAQTNVYNGSGYLTQIQDGGGKQIVAFAYSSTVAGRVHRVDSQRGMLGFDYNSARANCSAKTALYFNRGNTTSCTTDSDCGTGFLCGGNTGSGATGVCFRGARCLTIQNAAEDLVTTVTALGPPGQSCDGACLDVAEYLWDTSGTKLDLVATKDATNIYEVREFNANGLPTIISYGDPNSTIATSKGEREVFMEYGNANFPGKVTKVRRASDLDANASSCTSGSSTGCSSTTYTFSSDGKLATRVDAGTTLTSTGTNTSYSYTTTFTHDTLGRLTQIDHAKTGSNDLEVFEYWSAPTDPLVDGFLRYYKRKKGGVFLTQEAKTYDFRGNATTLADVDGTLSCQTFNAARGYLSERREAMANQTSCTTNAADLVTTYVRDSFLRLLQVTKPDLMCMFYEYDSKGRLSIIKRRDDCNAGTAGERQELTYDTEGLVVKTELFDAAGTVTKRQEWSYADSRRLATVINPVNTAKWTGLTYDARGLLTEVLSPDSLGKTAYTINPDRRVTSVDRYRTTSAFDRWSFLYAWLGADRQVTEDPSGTYPKAVERKRDDLARVVKVTSPDIDYPSVKLYDGVGNLVTNIELVGYTGQATHQFTFDDLDRPLNDDFHQGCSGAGAEIQRVYDAPPVTCPATGTGACARTTGRLAYVKVSLLCSVSYGDGSLDQETFYGYDDAGRLIREYIKDDSGRIADQAYEWTKAGALSKVTLPSTSSMWFNYGSAGSNSDTDRIVSVARNTATNTLVAAATYYPFGPLRQYNHFNTVGGTALRTRITRNLAYRVSQVMMETQTGAAQQSVTITEDTKGRVTARNYFPDNTDVAGNGVFDSYFLYDGLDRILCETTNLVGTCPSTGATIKNSHTASPPFTPGGDWKQLMRPIPGSSGIQHDFNPAGFGPGGYPTNHRVIAVRQNTGSPAYGDTEFGYNQFGRRTTDNNTTTLTNDQRDYTYNARGFVTNISGNTYNSGWNSYNLASAYDARGRRVYKSYYDVNNANLSQFFFYYDPFDRLTEIRYVPVDTSPTNYTVYQLAWLGERFVGYYQTSYPGATLTRRYVGTDETGRPIDLWSYPGSGNAAQAWRINPNAYGGEEPLLGPTVFQPFSVAMAYADRETRAFTNSGAAVHRAGLAVSNGLYDPFIASYLQGVANESPYGPGNVERDNSPECRLQPGSFACTGSTIIYDDWSSGVPGYMDECELAASTGGPPPVGCSNPLDGWFGFTWGIFGTGPWIPSPQPGPTAPPWTDKLCPDTSCKPYTCDGSNNFSCSGCGDCITDCREYAYEQCTHLETDLSGAYERCWHPIFNRCITSALPVQGPNSCLELCDCNGDKYAGDDFKADGCPP